MAMANVKAETKGPVTAKGSMREALDDYYSLKELDLASDADGKLREQPALVSRYYDVVTRFYEYAGGASFHFSPRRRREGLRAARLFLVQRADCSAVAPADEIDPAYGETLRTAARAGVEIFALGARVTARAIRVERQLPVWL